MSGQIDIERAWLVERRACGPALDWLDAHGLTLEEAWQRDDVLAEWQVWLAPKAGVPVRSLVRAAYGLALDVQDLAPAESREALAVVGRWIDGEDVSVVELRRASKAAAAASKAASSKAATEAWAAWAEAEVAEVAASWAAEAAARAAAAAAPERRSRHAQIVRDAIPWEEVAKGLPGGAE